MSMSGHATGVVVSGGLDPTDLAGPSPSGEPIQDHCLLSLCGVVLCCVFFVWCGVVFFVLEVMEVGFWWSPICRSSSDREGSSL